MQSAQCVLSWQETGIQKGGVFSENVGSNANRFFCKVASHEWSWLQQGRRFVQFWSSVIVGSVTGRLKKILDAKIWEQQHMERIIGLASLAVLWVSLPGASTADDDGPKIFQVSADDQAEYSSIQAAIDAAPAGAVVRIGPGEFQGPVHVSKPITLEGAGADRTFLSADWVNLHECLIDGKGVPAESQTQYQRLRKIAIEEEHGEGPIAAQLWQLFGPKPTLTVKDTNNVIVRGLSISMPGTVRKGGWQGFHMVLLENAGATVEGCAFVGSAVDGVEMSGLSTIVVQKCLIGGIRATGVVVNVSSGSTIRIADCDVRGCGYAGFLMKGSGDVAVSHCRISHVGFHGIRYDDTSPTITGNVFSNINRAGIYVDGKTKGNISDNLFFDCGTGGNEDLIANNTFVRRADPSPDLDRSTAIWSSGIGEQIIRNNVVSGYDNALILNSTDKMPLNRNSRTFEGNLCDTTNSAIVNSHRIESTNSSRRQRKPEIHDFPLPDGNWQMDVKFTDPEHGDYSLSPDQKWPARNLGARRHAILTSPWPEQPAERAMLDQIKEVEGQSP